MPHVKWNEVYPWESNTNVGMIIKVRTRALHHYLGGWWVPGTPSQVSPGKSGDWVEGVYLGKSGGWVLGYPGKSSYLVLGYPNKSSTFWPVYAN